MASLSFEAAMAALRAPGGPSNVDELLRASKAWSSEQERVFLEALRNRIERGASEPAHEPPQSVRACGAPQAHTDTTLAFLPLDGVDCGRIVMFDDAALARQAKDSGFVLPERVTKRMRRDIDYAGVNEHVDTFTRDVVKPLLYPNLFYGLNSLLMMGPPGNGKSLFAESIPSIYQEAVGAAPAYELRAYRLSASALRSAFQGQASVRVELLYKWLDRVRSRLDNALVLKGINNKRKAKIIIIIDELDGIAEPRDRAAAASSSAQITAAFLVALEAFPDIFTVSATNLLEDVDTAVVRRFHNKMKFEAPSYNDMFALIDMLVRAHVGSTPTRETRDKLPSISDYMTTKLAAAEATISDARRAVNALFNALADRRTSTVTQGDKCVWRKTPECVFMCEKEDKKDCEAACDTQCSREKRKDVKLTLDFLATLKEEELENICDAAVASVIEV